MMPVPHPFKGRLFERQLPALLGLYLDLALRSARLVLRIDPQAWDLIVGRTGEPAVIVVLWHEHLPLVAPLWWRAREDNPQLRMQALISRHRDGRMIAAIMRRWKIGSIDGSSAKPGKLDKGGSAALRTMLRRLAEGGVVALTPDGPRGPRRIMQPGAAQLAAMSGARVIAVSARCRPAITIRSWDRMRLPVPFARLTVRCGAPVKIERHDSVLGGTRLAEALEALDQVEAG